MGMEAIELVMDVRVHFGMMIQNTEAECVRTVSDRVMLSKFPLRELETVN